jgi:hypothetical protein
VVTKSVNYWHWTQATCFSEMLIASYIIIRCHYPQSHSLNELEDTLTFIIPKGKGSHCIMMCLQFSVIPKTGFLNHHINLKSCHRFRRLSEVCFKFNCILLVGDSSYDFLNSHNWFINIANILVFFKSSNEADIYEDQTTPSVIL